MTDQERHAKIAQALRRTGAEVEELIATGQQLVERSQALLKRSKQLLTLAEEFEAGKYRKSDAVSDDPSEHAEAGSG